VITTTGTSEGMLWERGNARKRIVSRGENSKRRIREENGSDQPHQREGKRGKKEEELKKKEERITMVKSYNTTVLF